MKKYLPLLTLLIVACSSSDTGTDNSKVIDEVELLASIENQRLFLEEIYKSDQKIRTDRTEILKRVDIDSKEYEESSLRLAEIDNLNLLKIEAYLKKHGHPSKNEHGTMASLAPWIVIHHQPGNSDARKANHRYLHLAWEKKDLDSDHFAFYLNRFYQSESGERLRLKNPFSEAQEIDTLLILLNLK